MPTRTLDQTRVWVLAQEYQATFQRNAWTWKGNVPTVQAIADRITWMWNEMVRTNRTRFDYGRLELIYDEPARRALVRLVVDETPIELRKEE